MKTLILFYSYTGKTKALAVKKAKEIGADIAEINEIKKPSKISAYILGSFKAMKQKNAVIAPINANIASYEKIIIMMPIWAGSPAPAMNNIIEILPTGKQIELIMTSASGKSDGSTEKTKTLITARNCEVVGYTDVKS